MCRTKCVAEMRKCVTEPQLKWKATLLFMVWLHLRYSNNTFKVCYFGLSMWLSCPSNGQKLQHTTSMFRKCCHGWEGLWLGEWDYLFDTLNLLLVKVSFPLAAAQTNKLICCCHWTFGQAKILAKKRCILENNSVNASVSVWLFN